MSERDGGDHGGEGDEREDSLEGCAVRVTSDAAVGGLEELFELAEENREAEIKDDPLGVVFADVGQLQKPAGGEEIERATENDTGGCAEEDDEPPAALEDAQSAVAVVAGDHHGHLIAGRVAETNAAEAEIGGNGVQNQPFAEERRVPEVQEDRDLDELDDAGGEFADPVDDEAKEQPPFC